MLVHVDAVDVAFTVKDSKGHLVPGLGPRDVQVYENGLRQHIEVFTNDALPMSVALVIDQSMTQDEMNLVNDALGALPDAFTASDEVAVFTYNKSVKEPTDFTAAQSPRLPAGDRPVEERRARHDYGRQPERADVADDRASIT